MAQCPKCNKQELQAGESVCPHCRNKSTSGWLKAASVLAAGALALATVLPMILSAVLKSKGDNKS
jgi:hypothetical protein